jgi:Fe-S cluster biogenesis protein NfuA
VDHIDFVLDRFNSMLAGDGASINRESLDGGVLTLRYVGAADDAECAACVLDPDDLEALIGEALVGKVDGVDTVQVMH